MTYQFKPLPELYWSVLTAAATVLLLELVALNPDGIQDWRTWAVALGVAIVRAAAGAALDWLRRSLVQSGQPEPVAVTPAGAQTVDALERPFVLHDTRTGCGGAGLLALRPADNDHAMLNVEDVRHLDGRTYSPGQPVTCDHCGKVITMIRAESGQWVAYSTAQAEGVS